MLYTVLMVLAGLVLVGILTAVFEEIGIKNPYLLLVVAAAFVIFAAYFHVWGRLIIGTGIAILLLMVRRDWQRRKGRTASL